MNANLRGLQLFRQLCRKQGNLAVSSNASSIKSDPVGYWCLLRRSLSAQPAISLTSKVPHVDDQHDFREAHHQAHESLLEALQYAINEGRADAKLMGDHGPQQKAIRRRRIMQEFAPMKLLLRRNQGSDSLADQQVAAKWEQQIKAEWASMEKLRMEYADNSAKLWKAGKGSLLKPSNPIMAGWFEPLQKAIIKEQEAVNFSVLCCQSRAHQ